MKSHWDDKLARRFQDQAGDDPQDRELALRIYTSRLIGAEPDLVQHGGGNVSVKLTRPNSFGEPVEVLHIKGSGWDMETIEAEGLPAVELNPLIRLREKDALSDQDMVAFQRTHLLDPKAPNPSIETLLHAFLPHKYVDHSHATAILSLASQPQVKSITREIFGSKVALVDYIMPGFALAKLAARIYEQNPGVEGLLLVNHGHFTFGEDAKTAYQRMIDHVTLAEDYIAAKSSAQPAKPAAAAKLDGARILPKIRGALASETGRGPVLSLRQSPEIDQFFARDDLASLANRGVATPDHVIRTKSYPLLLENADDAQTACSTYRQAYKNYFDQQLKKVNGSQTMLDPSPVVFWLPKLGIITAGKTKKHAEIAADLAEQTLRVIAGAETIGEYRPLAADDIFAMEYWPLEQAKLGRATPPPLEGKVVLITGAAGAIGFATAHQFHLEGAEIFMTDQDQTALTEKAGKISGAQYLALDITQENAASRALEACVNAFGGIDILVSNAGATWSGAIGEVGEQLLRDSFELNFWAHQRLAQAAVKIMRTQNYGGCLLFNISKQAVNPGRDFGPYGLPKAASFALLKQYALDHGKDNIRANGVNADRIRSGLMSEDMIAERAAARGVSKTEYMAGNLLQKEVRAEDVAQAFVALAKSERTTGHVMTVDGGNIEAALR